MRIRNKLTFLLYFTIFALLFLFFSCSTVDKIIPGKDEAVDKSVTAEYLKIAEAYEKLKDYPKAIYYYEEAMNSKAGSELGDSVYYNIGRCYALAKDWNHAAEIYKNLLAKDPDNTNLKSSLAYISAMKGDLKAAEEQYSSLIEENPTDSSLQKNYISVLLADGKKELAVKQFAVYKERFPDDKAILEIEKLFEPPVTE
ncbi:MAG: tetratricopeptide repeat protein [Treponema sp.]|nr:tetratricopeptide repeat protein [Treponema sp.]